MRGVSSLQSPEMTSICFYRTLVQARAKYLDMFLVSAAEPDQHQQHQGCWRRDLIIQDPAWAGRGGAAAGTRAVVLAHRLLQF